MRRVNACCRLCILLTLFCQICCERYEGTDWLVWLMLLMTCRGKHDL